jgi:hypothetical protein
MDSMCTIIAATSEQIRVSAFSATLCGSQIPHSFKHLTIAQQPSIDVALAPCSTPDEIDLLGLAQLTPRSSSPDSAKSPESLVILDQLWVKIGWARGKRMEEY